MKIVDVLFPPIRGEPGVRGVFTGTNARKKEISW